jgi:NitT/TauT family transport system permease protein/taurine transport system permease protein
MRKRLLRRLIWTVLILGAWEALIRWGAVSELILPAPSAVVLAAVKDGAVFVKGFWITLSEIVASIAIAWTLGLVTGLVAGNMPVVSIGVGSVLSSLFAIPLVIIYPVFMAWFGFGPASKITFGVLSGYFPVALNTLNGMRAIEPRYVIMARAMGASQLQLYTRVLFPLAIPSIVSGLRIGTGLVVIGVVVAEMLMSLDGIGFLISYHRTLFDTGHVYLGFIFTLVLAVGINRGLSALERRFGQFHLTTPDALSGPVFAVKPARGLR